MKKPIFSLITFITFSVLLVFVFSDFAASEQKPIQKLSDTELIRHKMNQLGFQIGKMSKSGGNYIIIVNGFTAKTQAVTKRGRFKLFSLTATVSDGQVILDKAGLQKQGFIIKESALPEGIKIRQIRAARVAPKAPTKSVSTKAMKSAHVPLIDIDLIIGNCSIEKDGESVIAHARLKNTGTESASFRTRETMVELNALGRKFTVSAPGGGRYIGPHSGIDLEESLGIVAPDTYSITWTADPANRIKETKENNNTRNYQFVIEPRPLPDMIVSQIVIQPTSGPPSTTFVFEVTIKNQGDAVAQRGTHLLVNCRMDGAWFLKSVDWGPYVDLSPGQSKTYFISNKDPLALGTHVLSCTVNASNRIVESNKNNNTLTAQFTVIE